MNGAVTGCGILLVVVLAWLHRSGHLCLALLGELLEPPPFRGVPAVRVLVIDDSRDTAHLVSVLVEYFGHETKVVTVSKVAVDIARDWQPEFVFMDLAMPEIDGYEMARQLRDSAGLKGARIFALSGHNENADKQKIAGIDGHVLKPISMVQIKSLLGDAR